MPVYVFTCGVCGPFELTRSMAEAGAPTRCSRCGNNARRVYTPPGIARLTRPVRRALDHEERSAHEPAVVTEKSGRPMPHRHAPVPPWSLAH